MECVARYKIYVCKYIRVHKYACKFVINLLYLLWQLKMESRRFSDVEIVLAELINIYVLQLHLNF